MERIFVAEDQKSWYSMIELFLNEEGFETVIASTLNQALKLAEEEGLSFEAAIVDGNLSEITTGEDGAKIIAKLREVNPQLHIIGHSGSGDGTVEGNSEAIKKSPDSLYKIIENLKKTLRNNI